MKGSHIVVPKVHSLGHAYILQNADKRVIFVIPFEGKFSLIGTTDVPVDTPEEAVDITDEGDATTSSRRPTASSPSRISRADVVSSFAGVRPLYDDGKSDPSSITRDYVLELDDEGGKAPLLSVFGGKITTYRCLAETALEKLRALPAAHGPDWTKEAPCPAATCATSTPSATRCSSATRASRATCSTASCAATAAARRRVLGDAQRARGPRPHFGAGLTAREIDCLVADEWARPPTTSCGAAPSAACTWTTRSAPPSPPTSPAASRRASIDSHGVGSR